MRWSCAGSRGFDGAHDGALHEFDLEVVVPAPLRALGGEGRCSAKRGRMETGTSQGRFHPGEAPWLGANPAKGHARLPNAAAFHIERHRRRDDGELERRAVAHLQVMRALRSRVRWSGDGRDYLAWF